MDRTGVAEQTKSHQGLDPEKLSEFCPKFAGLMGLLSRRWMGVVLRVLLTGPHRFNEILAAVPGLSDPLLTQRLRELEASHLVARKVLPSSPVRVEYELTEAGRDLESAVRVLTHWAEKWWTLFAAPDPGQPVKK
jgi:DNA-binding HxlR family transcriptional regulator